MKEGRIPQEPGSPALAQEARLCRVPGCTRPTPTPVQPRGTLGGISERGAQGGSPEVQGAEKSMSMDREALCCRDGHSPLPLPLGPSECLSCTQGLPGPWLLGHQGHQIRSSSWISSRGGATGKEWAGMGLGADWAEEGPPAGWPLGAASSLPRSPLHHDQQ